MEGPADKTETMSRYLAACESMANAETKVSTTFSKKDSVPAENLSPELQHNLFYNRISKEVGEKIDQISLEAQAKADNLLNPKNDEEPQPKAEVSRDVSRPAEEHHVGGRPASAAGHWLRKRMHWRSNNIG